MEVYRTRVLYQVNVHTGGAHPNKEATEKCLYFSRRFGLGKIFELNGIPESDYMEMYELNHNKGKGKSKNETTSKGKSKNETTSSSKGTEKHTMTQERERRPSTAVRKGSVVQLDDHVQYEKIVKIQSRMRGVIGRQNSEKLKLEKETEKLSVIEQSVKKSGAGVKKPRRSSIMGNKHSGSAGAILPIQQLEGELDNRAVKIQKRIRGVIGRQNSEKLKLERSKRSTK